LLACTHLSFCFQALKDIQFSESNDFVTRM
jgi:hypothetical protein